MTTITGISTAQNVYTEKGNIYKKTNKGKTAGAIAGALTAGFGLNTFSKTFDKVLLHHTLNQEKKLVVEAAKVAQAVANGKVAGDKLVCYSKVSDAVIGIMKTVPGKILGVAAFIAAAIGVGKAIGSVADGIINKAAQYRADKQAEQKEAIIKEFEASKTAEE